MLRVRLSYGAYDGPRCLHWMTWLWSWSFWIAFGSNSDKSHASALVSRRQLLDRMGVRFVRVIERLKALYPKLRAEIDKAEWFVIDATVFPGSDCDGNVVRRGVAIRPLGYQANARESFIDFPGVPDSVIDGLLSRCGTGYWWWGLFRLFLPKWLRPKPPADWREGDAFCDELIFVEAEDAGAPIIHPDVSPCDALPEYINVSPLGVHREGPP
jgi:hypothetical protein